MRRRFFIKQLAAAGIVARVTPKVTAQVRDRASSLFYRPEDGHVGDVIPFYDEGRFRIFYLHRFDDGSRGTSWYQVTTEDFVHFTDQGEMLHRGLPTEQDLSVATGSVIKHEGRYHIFYTGFNNIFKKEGKPEQGIMHAVSDDLLRWTKISADTFYASQSRYEMNDWRDPFVFWNPEAREFWMLSAARLKQGPPRRRGCTALSISKDLSTWKQVEPFWAPGLYFTHECPDLFKIGKWWYLVFSEFSERTVTRYRMAQNITGPWLAPEDDSFDGRALYAAKTVSDGHKRFLLGWDPTRKNDKDSAQWQWGGNLVVHQLFQNIDGTLSVKVPSTVDRAFISSIPLTVQPGFGKCETNHNTVKITAPEGFACAIVSTLPDCCKLQATITFTEGTRAFGLMLRTDSELNNTYYIRLEPWRNRVVFDMWPRDGDVPFMTGLERPVKLAAGSPMNIKVIMDNTIAVVYLQDRVALSTRMYDLKGGTWGAFVTEGEVRLGDFAATIMAA